MSADALSLGVSIDAEEDSRACAALVSVAGGDWR